MVQVNRGLRSLEHSPFGGNAVSRLTVWPIVAINFGARPAQSHTASMPPTPQDLWSMWSWQPEVLLPLIIGTSLYLRGTRVAWMKAGTGRGVRVWQAASFLLGVLAMGAALIWPLDALGDSLFSAHMAQHIVLMGIAAPLLVLGKPAATIMRALPRGWQRSLALIGSSGTWRRVWAWMTTISAAAALQVLVFLFWHAPQAIAVSLRNDPVHWVMHGTIFGCALLFWAALVRRQKQSLGSGLVSLLVMFKVSLISGALLAFAPVAFYSSYGTRPMAWGFSLLEDQQLAGLLMMTVGSMMYAVAAIILLGVWLRGYDGTARRQHARVLTSHSGQPL